MGARISKSFLEKRQESYENILSEKGILYQMNRSIQVEGAFRVLKNDYEFTKISASWENQSETGASFIVYGI
ncbi:MAG: transposase [Mediterraneibacter faecis]